MDLPWRLRTLARYIELLRTFEALHRACDPVIDGLLAIAAPSLSPGWSRRRERLSADLRQLRAGAVIPVLAAPALPTIDHAVGALYVFEGSALGGLRIAGEVDRRLPAARGARRYFTGEGRGTAARWRDVQSALAGWEHRGVQAGDRAVAGALETFALIDAQLRATGVA